MGAAIILCQSDSLDEKINALFKTLSFDGFGLDKNDSEIKEVFECTIEYVIIQMK